MNNTKNNKNKLNPKCRAKNSKEMGFSSEGYLLPCCWCELTWWHKPEDRESLGKFYQEHLHIDRINSIEDVLKDKVWTDFYDILENEPEKAPPNCWKYCGGERTNKMMVRDNE